MRGSDMVRPRHMLDAASEAMAFAKGRSRPDLDTGRQLVLALVKAIEVVGEGAYQVSREARERFPEMPWEDIVGMRHRLVHAYFDVNLDILWRTVQEDLSTLVSLSTRPIRGLSHPHLS